MSADQISVEYQRLICIKGPKKTADFSDRLKFLKDEYLLKALK